MPDDNPSTRRGFGYVALFLTLILGLVAGGIATAAVGHGMMRHFGGWSGHHRMHSPDERGEHVKHMVGFLSREVDATPEQQQKLTAIGETMAKEVLPLHEKFHEAHKKLHALLLQPTTDRAALETLRAESMALADEASKKLVQGLADAADVLTPAQRAKLADHWDF
jgi:Spy/CpxP family protein refolding chaperone